MYVGIPKARPSIFDRLENFSFNDFPKLKIKIL